MWFGKEKLFYFPMLKMPENIFFNTFFLFFFIYFSFVFITFCFYDRFFFFLWEKENIGDEICCGYMVDVFGHKKLSLDTAYV